MSRKRHLEAKNFEELHPVLHAAHEHNEKVMNDFLKNISATVALFQSKLQNVLVDEQQHVQQLIGPAAACVGVASPLLEPASPEGGAGGHFPASPYLPDQDKPAESGFDADEECATADVRFPNNTALLVHLRDLRDAARDLREVFESIYDWIALNIPPLKSDDDHDVQVMGSICERINDLNGTVQEAHDAESNYLSSRADMEKALIRYSGDVCGTQKLLLEVEDAETWDVAERGWRQLLRCSLFVSTTLKKNMKKLRPSARDAARQCM